MRAQAAYEELIRLSRERALLASCVALLAWDEETYMPPGGSAHRAEQLAYLAGLEHDRATDPRLGERLAEVADSDLASDPLSDAAVNVREWRRQYGRQTRLPRPLVEEAVRVTSLAQAEWAAARRDADFARFRPWLERVTALKRREAEAVGCTTEPYDALLDEYEPGATARDLDRLFSVLSVELSELAGRLAGAPRRPSAGVLRRDYPAEKQRAFGRAAAAALGFDFRRGRLDDTTHPFSARSAPATAASRRATTRTTSATPFSARCTRSATACTNRRWTRRLTACRSARRRRWAPTSRRPGCGRTPSAVADPSGNTSSRRPARPSPRRSATSAWRSSISPSTESERR